MEVIRSISKIRKKSLEIQGRGKSIALVPTMGSLHDGHLALIDCAKKKADIVVVRFGEKYKQWNAAFDAGYASALNKSLIIIHNEEHQHALKEVDAAALAVTKNVDEIVNILQYSVEGSLEF